MIPTKRHLSFSGTFDEQIKKFRKISCLEDLSNELFYEIFDYIDACDMYQAFSYLNNRFQNLLTHSLLPLKVKLSSDAQATLEHRCRHVIIPNVHRICSLHLSDDSFIDQFFDQCRVDSSFNRLESIVLNDISSDRILVVLSYLNSLPRLSSLTIVLEDDSYYDISNIYRLIFRFPCLTYSRVAISEHEELDIVVPMSINEKPSTITYLVMNFGCTLKELTSLILHTPYLRYLRCEHLLETNDDGFIRNEARLMLPHLTHISINNCDLDYDIFVIFIKKISSELRKLRLITSWTSSDFNADQWKQLIETHMQYLSKFHFENHVFDENDTFPNDALINQFTSSFFIERQWFFKVEYFLGDFIYSIHSQRKTWFNCHMNGEIIPFFEQFNFSSQSNGNTCPNLFIPPIQLTLGYFMSDNRVQSIIDRIKSSFIGMLFTHLRVDCKDISISRLIEIIRLLPNVCTLEISSLPQVQSYDFSPNDSEMLFLVSINNKITKVKLKQMDEMEQIYFLFDLFPHMQYLEVGCKTEDDLENLVKFIIMNTITYIRYLKCLCICVPNANEKMLENLKNMIDFERRFHVDKTFRNYTIQHRENKIYLKWELDDKLCVFFANNKLNRE